jgi:predicted nucleic acid-binding protein
VPEPGADEALALWAAAESVIGTRIGYVEVRSALAAARRARRLTAARLARAQAELAALWEGVDVVEVDDELAAQASALLDLHVLGGNDAIQLAAAQRTRAVLVTWDARLRSAALEAGVALAPAA